MDANGQAALVLFILVGLLVAIALFFVSGVRQSRRTAQVTLADGQDTLPAAPARPPWSWFWFTLLTGKFGKLGTQKEALMKLRSSPRLVEIEEPIQLLEPEYIAVATLYSGRSVDLRGIERQHERIAPFIYRGMVEFCYDWYVEKSKVTRDDFVQSGRLTQTEWDTLIGSPEGKKGPGWLRIARVIVTVSKGEGNKELSVFHPDIESGYQAWTRFAAWWESEKQYEQKEESV